MEEEKLRMACYFTFPAVLECCGFLLTKLNLLKRDPYLIVLDVPEVLKDPTSALQPIPPCHPYPLSPLPPFMSQPGVTPYSLKTDEI